MSIEIQGIDSLLNDLQKLENNLEEIAGSHEVGFSELFTTDFMTAHTQCSSFEDFLRLGGFIVKNQEDFDAIPDNELDIYVDKNSDFNSWEDMQQAAGSDYVSKKLNADL